MGIKDSNLLSTFELISQSFILISKTLTEFSFLPSLELHIYPGTKVSMQQKQKKK